MITRLKHSVFAFAFLTLVAAPAAAQTPNTAAIVVTVVDQLGGVVPDAKVSVVNSATGAARDVVSGVNGSATVGALPLTGHYKVSVTKAGFVSEDVPDLTLRAGETATVKVKLVATGGTSEVTVYGTTEGVRADAQIGRRLDSRDRSTKRRSSAARSRRCRSSTRRSARARARATSSSTRPTSSPASGSRRTTTYMLDGASNDEGWGRQTMLATVPVGAVQEVVGAVERVLGRVRLDRPGPAMNIVTKSGTNAMRGEALYMDRARRHAGDDVLDRRLLPAVRADVHDADDARRRSIPPTCRTS